MSYLNNVMDLLIENIILYLHLLLTNEVAYCLNLPRQYDVIEREPK